MQIKRLPLTLRADPDKVILRYRQMHPDRLADLMQRFEQMTPDQVQAVWGQTQLLFAGRHRNIERRLAEYVERAAKSLGGDLHFSESGQLLFGAYLAMEYSIEAAALFNPSIVEHPDQEGLAPGSRRFVLSLRAVGEGHISSVEFREGVIDGKCNVALRPDSGLRVPATIVSETPHHYVAAFQNNVPLSERVLFPVTANESNGMEDLRLVRDTDSDHPRYFGTYTAYDGHEIQQKLLETSDFKKFIIRDLPGSAVLNKGTALFPRKINGQHIAIGRQDGVSITMMYAGNDRMWNSSVPLLGPRGPHELTQIGNCGAPIETSAGWLLLTHGVGPMRRYTLGVALLDLENPERVLHVLPRPLMEPLENERSGYVPNVLYTCGWMQHEEHILIPYAMSDTSCGFAVVNIDELIETLKKEG